MNNIIIAGVGGQGILLASTILGKLAINNDLDVKLSEVHGMAQRGGSVVTYVRIGERGEKVRSPLIEKGQANKLISFELLETLRWISYLKPNDSRVYVNTQQILPMPVITGACEYPYDIQSQIINLCPNSKFIDALKFAESIGNIKTVNVILLGFMSNDMEFNISAWFDAIESAVKPKFVEINKKAFILGRNIGLDE